MIYCSKIGFLTLLPIKNDEFLSLVVPLLRSSRHALSYRFNNQTVQLLCAV